MHSKLLKQFICLLIACSPAVRVTADVLETKNGAHLVGKVVAMDGGVIVLSTDYAGDLKVKQSEVVSIATDAPLNVRLSTGTTLAGTLSSAGGAGALVITGQDGTLTTTVSKVATTWSPGAKDPAILALTRSWAYEVALDVTGKSGNKRQLGTSVSARAGLKTSQDDLEFYTAYDRQKSDGNISADQFKAGVDYQNNFSGKLLWYVRDEGGFDRVKEISLYNTAAAGLGIDLLKKPNHSLTFRAGLAYRYEGYKNGFGPNVSSAGLDLGFVHQMTFTNFNLVNRLSVVPSFEDFSNYRATHESFFEIPLNDPSWKVRLGLSNDYTSRPPGGLQKMDTTYFSRLVLDFK